MLLVLLAQPAQTSGTESFYIDLVPENNSEVTGQSLLRLTELGPLRATEFCFASNAVSLYDCFVSNKVFVSKKAYDDSQSDS